MTPRKLLGGIGLLSACVGLTVSAANADELKVFDQAGTLRSAADLKSGETANLKITIKGITKGGATTVALEDSAKKTVIQSAPVNEQGVALFHNVTSGTVSVKPSVAEATVATVEITAAGSAQHGKADAADSKLASKSIYVAGASAVAGVLGVSLANSDGSGSGNTGSDTGAVKGSTATNTGTKPGSIANTDGSSDNLLNPSFAAPHPGFPSPAPSTIVPRTPPSIPTPGDSLTGPTGELIETTPAAPAPSGAPSISDS